MSDIFYGKKIPRVIHCVNDKVDLCESFDEKKFTIGDMIKIKKNDSNKLDVRRDLIGQVVEINNDKYTVEVEELNGITTKISNLSSSQLIHVKTSDIKLK
jgi:hypothetical protein